MKNSDLGIRLGAVLVLASFGAGQDDPPRPPLPPVVGKTRSEPPKTDPRVRLQEAAKAKNACKEEVRYKGTRAFVDRQLGNDPRLDKNRELFVRRDFVPELRMRRYSALDPKFVLTEWQIAVERVQFQQNDTLVRVRVSPGIVLPGGKAYGVMTFYRETYRVAGGKLEFVDSEPLPENLPVAIVAL